MKSESESSVFAGNSSVYEVIRIIAGVPLFLEDHFERLIRSMQLQNWKFEMSLSDFSQKINKLILVNNQSEGNARFIYSSFGGNAVWNFSFIPHVYPDQNDYLIGVDTELLFDERLNPNAKVIQSGIREKADRMISEQKLYEVLLTDSTGLITEGSRSNVFFVKGNVFYTAPESRVLVGITREKVIACLQELGYRVVSETVAKNNLKDFDAVFLTGTSPKVLPVRSIGRFRFNPKLACVKAVMKKYDDLIAGYVAERKINQK